MFDMTYLVYGSIVNLIFFHLWANKCNRLLAHPFERLGPINEEYQRFQLNVFQVTLIYMFSESATSAIVESIVNSQ